MRKLFKTIYRILLHLFAIIGLALIITMIFYDFNFSPNWEAFSAIGTVLAVVVALFVTKWQELISNKKCLKIQWLHAERLATARIEYSDILQDKRIDEFCINLINTGNRKIVIEGVYIRFSDKTRNALFPYNNDTSEIKFPCILEPEMAASYHIPSVPMLQAFRIFIKEGHVKNNDDLIIEANDTTDKIYSLNTNIKILSYVNNFQIVPENQTQ